MTAKQKANQARFKKVVAEAKKLRKKNPKLTQAQAVKQAWAMTYSKKDVSVGATKKKKTKKKSAPTKVKAKKVKRTSEMHTDTKSHNVNIRVMSGVKKTNVNIEASKKFPQKLWEQQLAYALSFAKSYQTAYENSKTKREKAFNKKMVKYWQNKIKEITQYIIKPI